MFKELLEFFFSSFAFYVRSGNHKGTTTKPDRREDARLRGKPPYEKGGER